MKSLIWTVVLLASSAAASAGEQASPKTVKVTGISEVKVVPDRAVIEIGVEKQSPSAIVAKQMEDAAARQILASLRAKGVDEKDIQTTWLSLEPRSYYRKSVHISYFVATQDLTVTVRELAKLDQLLESLIKAGGNRIDSITYETSDLRKYRDLARDLAVKAAREKALALAHSLGQEIGKAQSIEELPEREFVLGEVLANVAYEQEAQRHKGPSTAAGQKSVSASVVVSFELN